MLSLEEYEKRIGYRFKNKDLLETALTHSSFANEHKCKSYVASGRGVFAESDICKGLEG